eukprot:UN3243
MGFVWKMQDSRWGGFLVVLRAFQCRAGHCWVPPRHVEAGFSLGRVVVKVRCFSMFMRGGPDRTCALEDMGFVFEKRGDLQWQKFQAALLSFKARGGHCPVPLNYKGGGYNLGPATRMIRFRGGFVKSWPERLHVLQALGFHVLPKGPG